MRRKLECELAFYAADIKSISFCGDSRVDKNFLWQTHFFLRCKSTFHIYLGSFFFVTTSLVCALKKDVEKHEEKNSYCNKFAYHDI